MNRYERVLSLLPGTIESCNGADIAAVREFLLKDDGLPRVFLGSGGSLSAAVYAMQLSLERGFVATSMTPYQYVCGPWSRVPAKVMIISAGGRNIDAINAFRAACACEGSVVGVMLMSTPSTLETMMDEAGETNKFVYPLGHRDGFLATISLVAFYTLLSRIYRDEAIRIEDWSFTTAIETELKEFIDRTYLLATDDWDEHHAALYGARETDRFYVLYSPDTMPVAIDLESRFSEGSVGCLQISDYRNFAHGRFNWFHQRKGQTAIIALVSEESRTVAGNILDQLPEDIPVMRLDSRLRGSDATMELLIKGMHIVRCLGERWNLDVGAPEVAAFGRVIHNLDFMPGTGPASD